MTLAALDDVDDAFEATRAFLLPFDAGRWLRLAVIAFFVGSAGGAGAGGGGGGGGSGGGPGTVPGLDGVTFPEVALSDAAVAAGLALVVLVLLVGLAFAAIGAVMEFVLVESLRREAVHLRRFFGRYWRGGLRLLGFRLGVSLLAVAAIAAVLGLGLLATGGPDVVTTPFRLFATLAVAVPVVLVVAVTGALVLGLTTDFVVPVMLLEGTTVLGGWRRFWPTLRRTWREYAAYVVVSFLLRLAAGLAVGAVVGVVAVVLVVPLGLVGVAGFLATGGQVGWGLLVGLALLVFVFVLALLAVAAVVAVPVVTYFRYYALLVLGDTEAAFDVVPERRAAIRADEGDA